MTPVVDSPQWHLPAATVALHPHTCNMMRVQPRGLTRRRPDTSSGPVRDPGAKWDGHHDVRKLLNRRLRNFHRDFGRSVSENDVRRARRAALQAVAAGTRAEDVITSALRGALTPTNGGGVTACLLCGNKAPKKWMNLPPQLLVPVPPPFGVTELRACQLCDQSEKRHYGLDDQVHKGCVVHKDGDESNGKGCAARRRYLERTSGLRFRSLQDFSRAAGTLADRMCGHNRACKRCAVTFADERNVDVGGENTSTATNDESVAGHGARVAPAPAARAARVALDDF